MNTFPAAIDDPAFRAVAKVESEVLRLERAMYSAVTLLLIPRAAGAWFHLWRLLRVVERMEREVCATCTSSSPACAAAMRDRLQQTCDRMAGMVETLEQRGAARLVIRLLVASREMLEDTLENYWMAADPGIHALAAELSSRLRPKHAA